MGAILSLPVRAVAQVLQAIFWLPQKLFLGTTSRSGLLPAPLYIAVDGEPEKTFTSTHLKNGSSTAQEIASEVRANLALPESADIRIFDSQNGVETTSTSTALSGRFYIVTTDGSKLGEHPQSVYRHRRRMTAAPPKVPLLGHTLHIFAGMRRGLLWPQIIDDIIRRYSTADLRACIVDLTPNQPILMVGDASLAHHIASNEEYWDKRHEPTGFIAQLRRLSPTGMATSGSEMPTWSVARRILLPAFSMNNLKKFFPILVNLADRLTQRLSAHVVEPGRPVDIQDLMNRITLDAIAKCSFDYDFGMLDSDGSHPFCTAMIEGLHHAQTLLMADPITRYWRGPSLLQSLEEQRQVMVRISMDVIAQRQQQGERKDDLLDLMLHAKDPLTGVGLSAANIVDDLLTFLVAGHETTSAMLAFTLYLLGQHPEIEAKVVAEIEAVMGPDPNVPLTWAQLNAFQYVTCVLKETQRLCPTAPAFERMCLRDAHFRQYYFPQGTKAMFNLISLHRDPKSWPEPERFQPERFLRDPVPGSYFPFGAGQRACIGSTFAYIEAKIVIVQLLRRFRLCPAPGSEFRLAIQMTLKLDNPNMIVTVRDPATAAATDEFAGAPQDVRPQGPASPVPDTKSAPVAPSRTTNPNDRRAAAPRDVPSAEGAAASDPPTPSSRAVSFYFGSNTGSCQELAQHLSETALRYGMDVRIAPLDQFVRDLDAASAPRNVIIVTSTYNGLAPDNARHFAKCLSGGSLSFTGVRYAVFGSGNSQWADTFQDFPIQVDTALEQYGGVRMQERGVADANTDWDEAVARWERTIWTSLLPHSAPNRTPSRSVDTRANFQVDLVPGTAEDVDVPAADGLLELEVVDNRELLRDEGLRTVHHLDLRLLGQQDRPRCHSGDQLAVLPRNAESEVAEFCARLGVAPQQAVRIHARAAFGADLRLPLDRPLSVRQLLRDYLDVRAPLNRAGVGKLVALADCPPDKSALQAVYDQFRASAIARDRDTLAVVLGRYRSLQLTLTDVVDLLPRLKLRYYSISSSPLLDGPSTVHLTVAQMAWTDPGGHWRHGLCSRYLCESHPGDRLTAWLHSVPATFHVPPDPQRPLLLVGSGTGIAPIRSWIRERVAQARAGADIGPIVVVFGCRSQATDFLYEDELRSFASELPPGKLTILTAFSRDGKSPAHVQDLLRKERSRFEALLKAQVKVFVCSGLRSIAPEVRKALADVAGPKRLQELEAQSDYIEEIWA